MKKVERSGIHILLVEDNDTMRAGMLQILKKAGHEIAGAASGKEGLGLLKDSPFDMVITDYKMSGMDGLEVLKAIKKMKPEIEVIVITAFGSIEVAVEAMKAGAWDFVTKPFSKEELLLKVDRVTRFLQERQTAQRIADENVYLREEVGIHFNYGEIVGETPVMKEIYRTIEKVAPQDTSILIYGESGTGKELIARALHYHSSRKKGPFIRVNCGALAEGVLESELFGHEKGAFTSALRQKKGRFELADRGTIFLDEIGDIPPGTQVKLLRVLQEKEFERVGGEETLEVDVRVITATHHDLLQEVRDGRFREDLYYRLHILPIHLPPLRERKGDIPLLADHFLKKLGMEIQKSGLSLTPEGIQVLMAYSWPGNVRELENVLERAVVLTENDRIDEKDLRFMFTDKTGTKIAENGLYLETRLSSLERQLIIEAMTQARGVKAKAARLLGVKESALYYKLEKYGLLEGIK